MKSWRWYIVDSCECRIQTSLSFNPVSHYCSPKALRSSDGKDGPAWYLLCLAKVRDFATLKANAPHAYYRIQAFFNFVSTPFFWEPKRLLSLWSLHSRYVLFFLDGWCGEMCLKLQVMDAFQVGCVTHQFFQSLSSSSRQVPFVGYYQAAARHYMHFGYPLLPSRLCYVCWLY